MGHSPFVTTERLLQNTMISHKHQCIFIEVPKTGSSSIRSIIGKPSRPHLNICQVRGEMRRHWTKSTGLLNHLGDCAYQCLPRKKRKQWGEQMFNDYFKFGFVRNPWDRVVSLYHRSEGLQLKGKMSFDEFVEWIKYSSSTCNHPVPHTNQLDWLVDPHGNILVDFIGRFVSLADDWKQVAKKLKVTTELPHKNKNPNKNHYSEYYNTKTRDIIARKFCIDIEHFEYTFDS
jgi:hypothetical protein